MNWILALAFAMAPVHPSPDTATMAATPSVLSTMEMEFNLEDPGNPNWEPIQLDTGGACLEWQINHDGTAYCTQNTASGSSAGTGSYCPNPCSWGCALIQRNAAGECIYSGFHNTATSGDEPADIYPCGGPSAQTDPTKKSHKGN